MSEMFRVRSARALTPPAFSTSLLSRSPPVRNLIPPHALTPPGSYYLFPHIVSRLTTRQQAYGSTSRSQSASTRPAGLHVRRSLCACRLHRFSPWAATFLPLEPPPTQLRIDAATVDGNSSKSGELVEPLTRTHSSRYAFDRQHTTLYRATPHASADTQAPATYPGPLASQRRPASAPRLCATTSHSP